jgi:hypothetical protein
MMFKFSVIAIVATTLSLIITNNIANAHMAMYEPAPRYSSYEASSPQPPSGQTYDYNIKSPIGTSTVINDPICKHTVPYDTPVATWSAGQTVSVKFQSDGAAHSGGHCQFSISYDNGKTFVVIQNEFRYCFFTGPASGNTASVLSYDIALPAQLPSGRAIFSWTWVNCSGNREFYMNCADVQINGNGNSLTGQQMLIANYGSQYPAIPEFDGNYDTGLDLYNSQPQITVYGSGGSNSTQPASSSPAINDSTDTNGNTYQTMPPVTPVQSNNQSVNNNDNGNPAANNNTYQAVSPVNAEQSNSQYDSNTPPAVNDNNSSIPDSCMTAAMRCSSSSNGFEVCNQGTWDFIPCSQGTQCCLTSNGFPECTW